MLGVLPPAHYGHRPQGTRPQGTVPRVRRRVQPCLSKGLQYLPCFCPCLQEGCPPCGALDEPFVGRLSMHVIAHRAVCPALVPWRGTALPSDIAPEPLERQHSPGAPHGEPGGPVAPCPRAVPAEGVAPLLCRRRGLRPRKNDAVWLLRSHPLQLVNVLHGSAQRSPTRSGPPGSGRCGKGRSLALPLVPPRGAQRDTACLIPIAPTRSGPWHRLWFHPERPRVARLARYNPGGRGGGSGSLTRKPLRAHNPFTPLSPA